MTNEGMNCIQGINILQLKLLVEAVEYSAAKVFSLKFM